jgi:hypothetical protein
VHEVTLDDANPDLFYAMCPNLGLLGVVSTITFKCVETFNIRGEEAITTIDTAPIDLFEEGSSGRPSLERFLRDTQFSRSTGGRSVEPTACSPGRRGGSTPSRASSPSPTPSSATTHRPSST